jgi:diguanylate cyclase (GGDEF)-like protein
MDNDRVLGVLCIGSPGIRPRDEKLMFQLVTNLGSLAMVNAEYRSRLADQANHDGLTGLLNKRSFERKLGDVLFETGRTARPVALFLFDIDHFKNYNDTNGHPAGDELLKTLAKLLRHSVRPDDLCCRWGGEEFIVAMPNTDGSAALQVAERIRQTIEEHPFQHRGSQPGGKVTISGGVSVGPRDGLEVATMTQHADEALYQSKRGGRNRTTRYQGVHIGKVDEEREPERAQPAALTERSE